MRLALVLCVVACRDSHEVPAPPPPPPTATLPKAAPPKPPPSSPHGGAIDLIAITDEGDAALTTDDLGGVRLWPTLDGTRPPLVVAATAPKGLALVHDGDDLLAAVLDAAGGLQLYRLGRDGMVHGKALVAPEPAAFQQIAPAPGGVLALRRDQTIVWLDARGLVRGQLVAEHPDRIAAIAVRRGGAIAALGDDEGVTAVRAIAFTPTLHWSTRSALPAKVRSRTLALSPDHTRIAVLSFAAGDGEVYALAPAVAKLGAVSGVTAQPSELVTAGFSDNEHAMFGGANAAVWWAQKADQVNAAIAHTPAQIAVGDRVALMSHGAALRLLEAKRERFLGYREIGVGLVTSLGEHAAMNFGAHILWLGPKLEALRATTENREGVSPYIALDDRLMLTLRSAIDPVTAESRTLVDVRDAVSNGDRLLGEWPTLTGVLYDRRTRVIALAVGSQMIRFAFDDHGAVTPLRALQLGGSATFGQPLDPALARGAIAVAFSAESGGQRIETFREAAGKGKEALKPATSIFSGGTALGVSDDGTAWMLNEATRVIGYRDGRSVTTFFVPDEPIGGTVSRDGKAFVLLTGNGVVAVDATGHERWRRSLWQANNVTLFANDAEVIVTTQSGLVALDVATGAQVATGCGWRFGLVDALPTDTFQNQPVCEVAE